jgi:hypothetical protein
MRPKTKKPTGKNSLAQWAKNHSARVAGVTPKRLHVIDRAPRKSTWRDKARRIAVELSAIAEHGSDEHALAVEELYRTWTKLTSETAMLLAGLVAIERDGRALKRERDPAKRPGAMRKLLSAVASATREESIAWLDATTLERDTRAYREHEGSGQRRGDEWLLAVIIVRADVREIRKRYHDNPKSIERLAGVIRQYAKKNES